MQLDHFLHCVPDASTPFPYRKSQANPKNRTRRSVASKQTLAPEFWVFQAF
jgi:hypothetical protein